MKENWLQLICNLQIFVLTQVECQHLVTFPFQFHFLGIGTQAIEPKTKLLPIGNLVLWGSKNPSMAAQQLHNKRFSLQNLSIRPIQRCLTVLMHKKHRFLLFGAYCIKLMWQGDGESWTLICGAFSLSFIIGWQVKRPTKI